MKVIPLAGDTDAMSQPAVGRRLSRDLLEICLRDHSDTERMLRRSPEAWTRPARSMGEPP
jgi:hypothetical protein